MTIWDTIYKNYLSGGKAHATIENDDGIVLFAKFIGQTNFPIKNALDIGCGTGNYLAFLEKKGFKTNGIDSSESAIEMTKGILQDSSGITLADMFIFSIPVNTYDLIFSIATIHHGVKEQVQQVVHRIHSGLIDGGHIFITLPANHPKNAWYPFTQHQKLAEGTFAPIDGPEKGLPHSFYSKEELNSLFSKFTNVHFELDAIGRWTIMASK